jgi:hypothetical protein
MNILERAFDAALRGAAQAKGEDEKVTFRTASLSFLCLEQLEDIGPGSGGLADKAPIKISLRKREVELPIVTLAEGPDADEVTIRGKTLKVLQYWPLEGRIDLLIGTALEQLEE